MSAKNPAAMAALLADRVELISSNKQLTEANRRLETENATLWEKLTRIHDRAKCEPEQRDKLNVTIEALTERQRELLRDREGLAERLKRAEAERDNALKAYKGAEDWCHELRRIAEAAGLMVGQRLSRDVAPAVVSIVRERDRLKEELTLLYEAFHPQNIANPREARQHIENLRQEGHWGALTAATRELHDEKEAHEAAKTELNALTDAYFQKYAIKAQVYGEMAYKWRKRCIDAGLSHSEDRILADEWQERERELSRLKAELDRVTQLRERSMADAYGQQHPASAPPYTAERREADADYVRCQLKHLNQLGRDHKLRAALDRLAAAPQDQSDTEPSGKYWRMIFEAMRPHVKACSSWVDLAEQVRRLAAAHQPSQSALELEWETGYGAGHSDARFASWGARPNPHSSTEAVLAKQGRARAVAPQVEPTPESDMASSYPDGHPWQLGRGEPHWVRVKSTGMVSTIADNDRENGVLLFAIRGGPERWYRLSELEPTSPPTPQPGTTTGWLQRSVTRSPTVTLQTAAAPDAQPVMTSPPDEQARGQYECPRCGWGFVHTHPDCPKCGDQTYGAPNVVTLCPRCVAEQRDEAHGDDNPHAVPQEG